MLRDGSNVHWGNDHDDVDDDDDDDDDDDADDDDGRQVQHSFQPNCELWEAEHPVYGLLPCVRLLSSSAASSSTAHHHHQDSDDDCFHII